MNVNVFRHQDEQNPFSYSDLLEKQKLITNRILEQLSEGEALLAEVSSVITFGRSADKQTELLYPLEIYQQRSIELLEVNRGGKATFHGKGQWVLFVVENLEKLTGDSKGIRLATELLLKMALEVCLKFENAEIRDGSEVGIWKKGSSLKLVSLGLQIKNRILQHGLCFNGYSTPESFFGINPCGIKSAFPGYLIPEHPSKEIEFLRLKELIIEGVQRHF